MTAGLNRIGIFLPCQQKHAFRQSDRIVVLHDGMNRTAALAPAESDIQP